MPELEDSVPLPRRPMSPLCSSNLNSRPIHGDEIAKKIAKKNVSENKVEIAASKNSCICSPTNHAGSFRCHLHRTTPRPMLYPWPEEDGGNHRDVNLELPFTSNFANNNKGPQLSRFGRASKN